jgi:sugar/nucleoside kinase (ribokinase family)
VIDVMPLPAKSPRKGAAAGKIESGAGNLRFEFMAARTIFPLSGHVSKPHIIEPSSQGDRMKTQSSSPLIIGVGSALVDILLQESDSFLSTISGQKGGMTLVAADRIDSILAKSTATPSRVPGGSACNTILGIGQLGGHPRFIGKRGKDELGGIFEKSLVASNVEPRLSLSDSPTGRVLSLITPDAQRSMFTYLGASSETKPVELTPELFKDAALVHLEGYLLFNKDLIMAALKVAKEAGARISLDMASFTVVQAAKDILRDIIRDYVDILLANEDEARAYTGLSDERAALNRLSSEVDVAVVKIGKRGSLITTQGKVYTIGILGDGSAKDTTGAGDLWAAGFLYGLVNGMPIDKCGRLGAACGYEVCQVIGATIPDEGWERIRKIRDEGIDG